MIRGIVTVDVVTLNEQQQELFKGYSKCINDAKDSGFGERWFLMFLSTPGAALRKTLLFQGIITYLEWLLVVFRLLYSSKVLGVVPVQIRAIPA